jgi:hypothetical protein
MKELPVSLKHRLDLKLYSLAESETPQLPPSPRIWAHTRPALLVRQDRLHLLVTTCFRATHTGIIFFKQEKLVRSSDSRLATIYSMSGTRESILEYEYLPAYAASFASISVVSSILYFYVSGLQKQNCVYTESFRGNCV